MYRYVTRVSAAAAAGVALAGLAVMSGASAGPAALGAVRVSRGAWATSGSQLWVKRYDGLSGSTSRANAVAASPTGKEVFVTGSSTGKNSYDDYATAAYNAATGARLWVRRYSPGGTGSVAQSLAVSPGGRTVFVTGYSHVSAVGDQYTTIAYSAATGKKLWIKNYSVSGYGSQAASVAVSPAGGAVYVTGEGIATTGGTDYATVAYSASTGKQLWAKIYRTAGESGAVAVAASRTGTEVFVTGTDYLGTYYKYATVAYRAATGKQLWAKIYGAGSYDQAYSLAASPTGKEVFVTGRSIGTSGSYDYATVAYSASSGKQLWAKRYDSTGDDEASSVAVSPSGSDVYVTGYAGDATKYATVAYSAANGSRLWVKTYAGPFDGFSPVDYATSVAVSPRGTVFVTGDSEGDYATIAYKG